MAKKPLQIWVVGSRHDYNLPLAQRVLIWLRDRYGADGLVVVHKEGE